MAIKSGPTVTRNQAITGGGAVLALLGILYNNVDKDLRDLDKHKIDSSIKVAEMAKDVENYQKDVEKLNKKVDEVDKKVDRGFDEVLRELRQRQEAKPSAGR